MLAVVAASERACIALTFDGENGDTFPPAQSLAIPHSSSSSSSPSAHFYDFTFGLNQSARDASSRPKFEGLIRAFNELITLLQSPLLFLIGKLRIFRAMILNSLRHAEEKAIQELKERRTN